MWIMYVTDTGCYRNFRRWVCTVSLSVQSEKACPERCQGLLPGANSA